MTNQNNLKKYIYKICDQKTWKNAEEIRKYWNGPFCLKGIMSAEDAKMAVKIGASAIMVSNHGGRQLDGSRSPFDPVSYTHLTLPTNREV